MSDDAAPRRTAAPGARYWIGVASREHVRLGRRGGFAQFAHGKPGPAKRLSKGDWVVYYSSRERYRDPAPCQMFTALGQVTDAAPFRVTQAPGFAPYRRKVRYERTQDVSIRPLIARLAFIKNKARWGAAFRFGFLEVPASDFHKIATRMRRTVRRGGAGGTASGPTRASRRLRASRRIHRAARAK